MALAYEENQEETKIIFQIGLNLSKLVLTCPDWSRIVQIGPNVPKLV